MTFCYEQDRIFAKNEAGSIAAEVTFPAISETTVCLHHTLIDESVNTPQTEDELFGALVEVLRTRNLKTVLSCPRASRWFRKNPQFSDVLFFSR